ncbi:type VI secretion system baseplate subunit TssG [Deminuibacter soli]|uniref:Type VI secretion system baseplate subunit TssG n=1 Tax=Deminuibacter soli TaxID=2291815 RepID=A0A3E1NC63_9BACT|nr:type VI secretion system baseplate subunit TssG [Deminuibacter soli]RFM25605.1 hypothetical protein DXN05_24315 [Deminuibacter soli]
MNTTTPYPLNDLHSDYKAAVLAAELIEKGVSPESLFIWPVGGGVRNFSKDVIAVEQFMPEQGDDMICIKSSREGLYDMLPEGLFHQGTAYSTTTSIIHMVDQIKQHRQEEKETRLFFLPFEAEMNFLRIVTELYENRVDKKNTYADLVNIFRPQWEIFRYLNLQQSNAFLHFIPLLSETRGDFAFFGNMLSLLLQLDVTVRLQPQPPVAAAAGTGSRLGESALGIDLFAGKGFNDGSDEVVIEIGPLTAAQAAGFLPGTASSQVVNLLAGYCLPADLDVRVNLLLEKTAREMDMSEHSHNNVLGYTAFL